MAAVLGVVAFAAAFQPFQVPKVLWFVPAWLAVTLGAIWIARRLPRGLVRGLTIVLWNVCLLLVVIEVGLEVIVRTMPSPLFARVQGDVEALVRLKAQEPGWTFLGFPFNRQGWYDEDFPPKSPRRFRVVSISDSFAWGTVPHHFHFTTVCERLAPGCEVLNLGLSATGPDVYEYLIRHHARPLVPDLIVVNLFIGNDLQELMGLAPEPWLGRLFDRERLLTYRIPERILILARESQRKAAELPAITAKIAEVPPAEKLLMIRPADPIAPERLAWSNRQFPAGSTGIARSGCSPPGSPATSSVASISCRGCAGCTRSPTAGGTSITARTRTSIGGATRWRGRRWRRRFAAARVRSGRALGRPSGFLSGRTRDINARD